jgi:transposase
LFNCNIDAEVFTTWTKQDLLPKLKRRSVIVMDNATFHKRADTIEAINKAGHELLFLPPYSPELNPIEKKWDHLKSIRRKLQCSAYSLFQSHVSYHSI